jgi:hypothetical protein
MESEAMAGEEGSARRVPYRKPLLPLTRGRAEYDGEHRLWLRREWVGSGADEEGHALWIGLAPGYANGTADDELTRRQQTFTSNRLGLAAMVCCNLCTITPKNPSDLWRTESPIHDSNTKTILHWAGDATTIILGFGTPPEPLSSAAYRLLGMLKREMYRPICFGKTPEGWPRNYLKVGQTSQFEEFRLDAY